MNRPLALAIGTQIATMLAAAVVLITVAEVANFGWLWWDSRRKHGE